MKKYLGIEFGSTRIKGVLIDENHNIIASGSHTWENVLRNGVWTYSLDDAKQGLRNCYSALKREYEAKYDETLSHIDAIGISGMMHGYLVFDKSGKQLAEFRTWRNTITEEASNRLTKELGFHVPQRWSACHVYQAILNGEPEAKEIAFMTTLAGYFHYLLTGRKVLGIGEASGVFPIDENAKDYNQRMVEKYDELVKDAVPWTFRAIAPKVLVAGEDAGSLTAFGRDLLDASQNLECDIPFCPPEGDMGTGMVATNSLGIGTGNASIGTSSNLTIVTGRDIGIYPEIDVITSPTGINAALVHVNNGTSEINAWEKLFKEVVSNFDKDASDGDVYSLMFNKALEGDKNVKGLYGVDYFSGEPVTRVNEGKLLFMREPDAKMDLANFMRLHIDALLATIRIGADILRVNEGVKLTKVVGHGGFFKTPRVGQLLLSASLDCPVATLASASEGGPYGEAILAAYLIEKQEGETLEDYVEKKVFAKQDSLEIMADPADVDGFESFLVDYKKSLHIEKEAIRAFKKNHDDSLEAMKQRVYEQNMRLAKEGLVTLTWGNVSEIDRGKGIVVIKPSGVPYEKMSKDDMVVLDLDGNVIEGKLNPSSDTPTHLELYRKFPNIGGIVHTHSTHAVAFAQARQSIVSLGTTHADTFYKEIPCTRALTKEEIESDYELNTGKVIVETFASRDPIATPGVIVASHGPFSWGKSAKEAVDHAIVLEEVAKMAILTRIIDARVAPIDPNLEEKHYQRKHGKNAYYGQKEEN